MFKKKRTVSPFRSKEVENVYFVEEKQNRQDKGKRKRSNPAQKKWKSLKNSIRFTNAVMKEYERINFALIEKKDQSKNGVSCLLKGKSNKKQKLPLIDYFVELAKLEVDDEKVVDYSVLEGFFRDGVDINATDKYGQAAMHEVARIWHTDVAHFMLQHGANINQPDNYGRTPLHVAAAVDFPEMVTYLLSKGAGIKSRTVGELQTPLHYSAKNDASQALEVLLKHGASINDRDHKSRTPLQLAAELDRSSTAQLLVDEGAAASVYDDTNTPALVLLIQKMPNVALAALDQFHQTDRATRRQHFYLNFLQPSIKTNCYAKSPLEMAVETKQYQVLLHPVMSRLIAIKWNHVARIPCWISLLTNLLLCVLWTSLLCTLPTSQADHYKGSRKYWGPVLEAFALLTFIASIAKETRDFIRSEKRSKLYRQWRMQCIQRDLKFCHARWPDERAYLKKEMNELGAKKSSYISEKWNIFDWLTYISMGVVIICYLIDTSYHKQLSTNALRAAGSVMMICMWFRLLKYARPFKPLGLFVIMVGHVIGDTLKILFLAFHIFVPYIAAFYITFGAKNVDGYIIDKNLELFYTLFQITVVGDYSYDNIKATDQLMAQLLCGTYIFFAGIICLNLYIALMSNTFQRVYDNAKANAMMQRAFSIVKKEASMSYTKHHNHVTWLQEHCGPESTYYDDDVMDHENTVLVKKTHEIEQKLAELRVELNERWEADKWRQQQSDSHDVLQFMKQFRGDYERTNIQTRAEIAGLGLMLKDLIEGGEEKGVDMKDMYALQLPEPGETTTREEQKNQRVVISEGFFEGYSYQDQHQAQNSSLIKSKWNSIFSQIVTSPNDDESLNETLTNCTTTARVLPMTFESLKEEEEEV